MNKTLITLIFGLFFTSSAFAKYETTEIVSKFDQSVSRHSTPALVSCNEWKEQCPFLTFSWTSKAPDSIGIAVGVNTSTTYYNFKSLSFNLDGEISTFENMGLTDHKFKSSISTRESTAMFVVPKAYYDKLVSSKKILMKLTTQSDGSFERAILDDGVESKAYKAIKAFKP